MRAYVRARKLKSSTENEVAEPLYVAITYTCVFSQGLILVPQTLVLTLVLGNRQVHYFKKATKIYHLGIGGMPKLVFYHYKVQEISMVKTYDLILLPLNLFV